ncbi:tyrosine-type recombinase/integrase [Rhizobium sp. PL01]|uniref:tyrosine-type recombinase/integrase n=1 Tax=Rhizobium sp. PL01 TaxID=3085631 RepID=UPI0029826888|nr:tyrosine-type recombinase/integrase [Rhizobium sp. PL01]MDW5312958.1 tyrosine-type recombinase/integrase [Rhizobium sp. PL01]
MARKIQSDEDIEALPWSKGNAYFVHDSVVPKLQVRVGGGGIKTFVMRDRYGHAKNPATRSIGDACKMSVETARAIAIHWSKLNRKGIDPAEETLLAELKDEEYRRQTFRHVLEDYLADQPNRIENRQAHKDVSVLTREFLDPEKIPFLDKPIRDVTASDVKLAIEAIRVRPAATQALNMFCKIKTFFNWVLASGGYGVTHSPLANLKIKPLKLQRIKRKRSHTSDEVRCYWAACEVTKFPLNEFFRAALLTGQRKNEIRLAEWSEIDLRRKLWTIPACRFKTNRVQLVPLSVPMMQLLERIKARQSDRHGPFVFSRTDGEAPMGYNGKDIQKFREILSKIYLANHPEKSAPERWSLHDNRRTVRTALSNLGVPTEVAEAVIGHIQVGLEDTYNTNTFRTKRRRALHLWAEELAIIVADPDHRFDDEEYEAPEWPSRWNDTRQFIPRESPGPEDLPSRENPTI